MDANFIVSPIVGGVIGGFANWLAIQMLFFPLKEKRIFGKRIPFTPGLIPKERKRIAESVANTVANYFLSEDVIVDAVVSPSAEIHIKSYIKELIEEQKESRETVGQIVERMTGKRLVVFVGECQDKIAGFIKGQVVSPALISELSGYISKEFEKLEDKSFGELIPQENLDSLKNILSEKFLGIIESNGTKKLFEDVAFNQLSKAVNSKKRLNEMLPQEVFDYIKVKAAANSDKVAQLISDYITSSTVQFRLRKLLKNSFDSSFRLRMISKVVDVEKIFETLFEEIVLFLEQPENHREIAKYLISVIDSAGTRKIKDLSEEYDLSVSREATSTFIERFINAFGTKENMEQMTANIFESKLQNLTLGQLVDFAHSDFRKNKQEHIYKIIESAAAKLDLDELIKGLVEQKVNDISNLEISKLAIQLRKKDIEFIENAVVANFKRLIRGQSDRILKVLDISKIVEERINAFDIGEMEEIMLGVIRKDIVVMRAFEAGIGFLIGFIIPLYPYVVSYIASAFK